MLPWSRTFFILYDTVLSGSTFSTHTVVSSFSLVLMSSNSTVEDSKFSATSVGLWELESDGVLVTSSLVLVLLDSCAVLPRALSIA